LIFFIQCAFKSNTETYLLFLISLLSHQVNISCLLFYSFNQITRRNMVCVNMYWKQGPWRYSNCRQT